MSGAQHMCIPPGGFINITSQGVAKFGEGTVRQVEVEAFSYCWLPRGDLRANLPDRFCIEFNCFQAADGVRRFTPVGGHEIFIRQAVVAGAMALEWQGKINATTRKCFSQQFLTFQLVRRMREHLGRNFDSSHDLYVNAKGRGGEIGLNLLPEDVTFDHSQRGPVSVDVLMREGRNLAMAEGIVKPDEKTAIQYGLFELARRNSRRAPDQNTSALFRLALFDASAGEMPGRDVLKHVRNRIDRWLDDHSEDSTKQFNDAFFPGKSNFIKAIGDQRGSPGGMLEHALVRQAILQLGWESYRVVGRCIEAFMRQFVECLPKPVTAAERRLICELYFRRPYFANLPLMLFLERGSFIKKAITELWEQPGDELRVGTLHRLLEIYGQMVLKRREADRRSKQKSAHSDAAGMELSGTDLVAAAPATPRKTSVYGEIAKYLAERDDLHCSHCPGRWQSHLASDLRAGALPDFVALTICCECEQFEKEYSLSLDEFQSLAARFMVDRD